MKNYKLIFILSGIAFSEISCEKFLEIPPPKSSLVQETVFKNNDQATSAVTGIYSSMSASSSYASGSNSSITCFAGLSSDELIGYNLTNLPFYENQLTPEFISLQTLYSSPYKTIYTANSIIEGLSTASGVTTQVKSQLEGEALFIRAFAYFYLVNLFGQVPLHLTADYRTTQTAYKASTSELYQQIIKDLKASEILLSDTYPTAGRVRPNRSAAQCMLARTYLYLQDWENAEKYATLVIQKTTVYSLVNLDAIFLANSNEAIWQLMPTANSNTQDGLLFNLTTTPIYVSLRNNFATGGFEPNDRRQTSWVKSFTNSTGTYYYPNKYKIRSSTTVTEFSMILRLAEQYLIRAEARINQGKIDAGITDLNLIRTRARPAPTVNIPNPLPPLSTTLSKTEALLAVERERKIELFSEWGHRWFDLKRTGRADEILGPLKSKWQSTDVLYPIPSGEINLNKNITQNPGY